MPYNYQKTALPDRFHSLFTIRSQSARSDYYILCFFNRSFSIETGPYFTIEFDGVFYNKRK